MSARLFDAAPQADYKARDRQTEISVDYRLCYQAMGAGHEHDRQYLAAKYGRELKTVGQLNALGQELFAKMDANSRAYDLYDAERALNAAIAEDGPDHA